MKTTQVEIKNVKAISHLEMTPNGSHVLLTGDNDLGKSTVLQIIKALTSADLSILPDNIIREGEKEGYAEIITGGDGKEYTLRLELRAGKKPKLTIKTQDGLEDNKVSAIAKIVGGENFDVWEFVKWAETEAGRKKQLETVKSYFDTETQEFLRKMEIKIKTMYDDRTEYNRQVKQYEGFLAKHNLSEADFVMYEKEIPVSEIQNEYEKATRFNSELQGVAQRIDGREKEIEDVDRQIASLMEKAEILKKQQEQAKKHVAENEPIDLEPIKKKLDEASNHNAMYAQVKTLKDYKEKLDDFREQSENMTIAIDSSREELKTTIMDIGLPVEGLTFDADQLLYNGLPVDTKVLSTSDIMLIGIKLQMAKNPNARVLCMEGGESIGSGKWELLMKLAKEHDFQLFIEEVKRGQKELTYEFIPA